MSNGFNVGFNKCWTRVETNVETVCQLGLKLCMNYRWSNKVTLLTSCSVTWWGEAEDFRPTSLYVNLSHVILSHCSWSGTPGSWKWHELLSTRIPENTWWVNIYIQLSFRSCFISFLFCFVFVLFRSCFVSFLFCFILVSFHKLS